VGNYYRIRHAYERTRLRRYRWLICQAAPHASTPSLSSCFCTHCLCVRNEAVRVGRSQFALVGAVERHARSLGLLLDLAARLNRNETRRETNAGKCRQCERFWIAWFKMNLFYLPSQPNVSSFLCLWVNVLQMLQGKIFGKLKNISNYYYRYPRRLPSLVWRNFLRQHTGNAKCIDLKLLDM
jgi:hypothetical protein